MEREGRLGDAHRTVGCFMKLNQTSDLHISNAYACTSGRVDGSSSRRRDERERLVNFTRSRTSEWG